MKRYKISVPVSGYRHYWIDARSEDDALNLFDLKKPDYSEDQIEEGFEISNIEEVEKEE